MKMISDSIGFGDKHKTASKKATRTRDLKVIYLLDLDQSWIHMPRKTFITLYHAMLMWIWHHRECMRKAQT